MEKVKNILLGFATFLCVIILMSLIMTFSFKKSTEKYLDEKKINEFINNINILDFVLDENGNEFKEFKEIKEKLIDSGIPVESIDGFFRTKPVDNYAKEITSKSISNTINNKSEKLLQDGEIYKFLDNNIENISSEMREKNIPQSDKLTKENQEKFLEKVKEKTPDIESKLNELSDKVREKFNVDNYIEKIDKGITITRFLYNSILDLVLISMIIIFVICIFITRQSIINGLKWTGITFMSSSLLLFIIIEVNKIISNHTNKITEGMRNFIKKVIVDLNNSLTKYSFIYLTIGIILIIVSIIIYFISEKIENKQIKKYL